MRRADGRRRAGRRLSTDRLPAHIEVAGLLRRVSSEGGFATILRKGDAERGSILLFVSSKGRHVTCLERVLDFARGYVWETVGPSDSASSTEIADFFARRTRFDEDSWAIELDIADAERFIAETKLTG